VVASPFRSLDQVVMSKTLGMMLQPNWYTALYRYPNVHTLVESMLFPSKFNEITLKQCGVDVELSSVHSGTVCSWHEQSFQSISWIHPEVPWSTPQREAKQTVDCKIILQLAVRLSLLRVLIVSKPTDKSVPVDL
jgi:hypothetical protein